MRKLLDGTTKSDKELSKIEELSLIYEKACKLLEQGVEHPKVEKTASLLLESLKNSEKAIVFTQYRETVDTLYKYLKKFPALRPVKFIGQGRGGLLQKEQISIVKDFEAGVYNVLVSTSVSEEGISIKGVDLAIFYDSVPSAIRSIQRRGRVGRFNVGKIFLLITEGTSDEAYYWVSKKRESKMKRIIKDIKDNPDKVYQDGTLNPFV
jgi:Fanconi anemia group M protein